jgi:hypothetical protein
MPQSILVFDTWLGTPHTETSLEIAELHQNSGDRVYYVHLGAALPFKDFNEQGLYGHLKANNKINNIKRIPDLSFCFSDELLIPKKDYELPHFSSLELLRAYTKDGIDVGMALASSLITQTRDLNPDVTQFHALLSKMHTSGTLALESFKAWCLKVNPDVVYLCNGRTILNRPILRYCQQQGMDVRIHERGCNPYHYEVTKGTYRHDRDTFYSLIMAQWNDSTHSLEEKQSLTHDFYSNKKTSETTYLNHTKAQIRGKLPPEWDATRKNVVFFTKSMSESVAIDFKNSPHTLFQSQPEAIDVIAELLAMDPNVDFYVREHPNTPATFGNESKSFDPLRKDPRIRFIDGNSAVDTYALIDQSSLVITYMSTTGIEAAYWGKPSIVVGNSYYQRLGSIYAPNTLEDLKVLLFQHQLPALPRDGAIIYGYYMATFGTPFVYFSPTGLYSGRFKGIDLDQTSLQLRVTLWIVRLIQRVFKRLTRLIPH